MALGQNHEGQNLSKTKNIQGVEATDGVGKLIALYELIITSSSNLPHC